MYVTKDSNVDILACAVINLLLFYILVVTVKLNSQIITIYNLLEKCYSNTDDSVLSFRKM